MKNIKARTILAGVLLGAVLLALSVDHPSATVSAKEDVPVCSVQTLAGPYGNSFQFLNLPPGSTVPQPLGFGTHTPGAGIGLLTFDGQGNFSGPQSTSVGGLILQGSVTGTYTVNADCTGSMVLNLGAGVPPALLGVVIVDDGKEVRTLSLGHGEISAAP